MMARLSLRRFFGPGVAEGGGAVEDGAAGLRVDRIGEEVAEALELEKLAGFAPGRRLHGANTSQSRRGNDSHYGLES